MRVGVEQRVSPIRYMFLIQPDDEVRLMRAVQTASTLWGGMNSPIFPFYKSLPEDVLREYSINVSTATFYTNTLLNYDPDIIFFDEDLDLGTIKSLTVGRELISLVDFTAALTTRKYDNCITVMEICRYVLENEFKYQRTDALRIKIPEFKGNEIFLHVLCGSILPAVEIELLEALKNHPAFERPILDWISLSEYRNSPRIDIQEFSYYELNSWLSDASPGHHECVYFLDTGRPRDVMNFWNLRAAGWTVIPVALNKLNTSYFAERFDKVLTTMIRLRKEDFVTIDFLIPRRYDAAVIQSALETLAFDPGKYEKKVITPLQQWFPRFWAGYDESRADHIRSHQPYFHNEYRQYTLNDETVEILVSKLPFEFRAISSRRHAYKVLLELSPENEQLEYAGVLSGISNRQLKSMLGIWTSNNIFRLSDAGIFVFTQSNADLIRMQLPSSTDFFNHYFANQGYRVQVTANSKLAKEVLRNMGGISNSRRLMSAARLKIIEGFENGKIMTFDGLMTEIKKLTKTNKNDAAKELISMLLTHKIIELGARIQCSICNQHGFYSPAQINDILTCPICRNNFDLPRSSPADIVWAYRGIGPFSRNNKADGVMSVFATAFLLQDGLAGVFGQVSAMFGFELNKNGRNDNYNEVDLCIMIGGRNDVGPPDLVLCECKTYKRFEEVDMKRLKILGDAFPGIILVVATLNENLHETEKKLISDLVKYFQQGDSARPRNPVLILTGKELLPENYKRGFDEYLSKISYYQHFTDLTGTLCELTVKTHLQIPAWSDLLMQRHTQERKKGEMISAFVQSLINYASSKPES